MRCGKGPHGSGTAFCEFFFFFWGVVLQSESSAVRPPVSHVLFFFCFFGFLQDFFVFGF